MRKAALMMSDARTGATASSALAAAGCGCERFNSCAQLVRALRNTRLDAVLIEIDRTADWRAVLERRDDWLDAAVPLILVGPPERSVEALQAGADDFVSTHPLNTAELVARLDAAVRRRAPPALGAGAAQHAGCAIDEAALCLVSSRARVPLTRRELAVARIMFSHVGERVSRRHLSLSIWGCDEDISGRSMEQHMYELRRKLRRCVGDALALRTVYGGGYRLEIISGSATAATTRATASYSDRGEHACGHA